MASNTQPADGEDGVYLLPYATGESAVETNRLDEQHRIFTLARRQLSLVTTSEIDRARRVLDLGCGTGIWCADFARAHPSADVYGIDIAPPSLPPSSHASFPPNTTFFAGNVENAADWACFPGSPPELDYIHARLLIAGVQSWPAVFQNVAAHLTPGGWFETYEGIPFVEASDARISAAQSPAIRWFQRAGASMRALGLDPSAPERFPAMLRDAGLEVRETRAWTMCLDPARNGAGSPEDGEKIAQFQLRNWTSLVEEMTPKMAAYMGDDDARGLRELADEAKRDLKENGRSRGYLVRFFIHIAQKPE